MLSADFPALQTAIDEFAWKQTISRKLANAMLTVAEELCVQTILLMLPDHGVVELVFEYSGENEEIRFRAEYGGEGGNVLENDTIPHARVCPRMGDFGILCFLTRRDQTSRAASTTQRMRS